MKRTMCICALAIMLVLSFGLASCEGDMQSPGGGTMTGPGTETGAGGDTGMFVGTWRSTQKLMFEADSGNSYVEDYIYMKADVDSVIFYVPAFGSTADLPYTWSKNSHLFSVTENGTIASATVYEINGNLTFAWGTKPSVMPGLTGVPQMMPYTAGDVDIQPGMSPEGGDPAELPSEPDDPEKMLTIQSVDGVMTVTDCDSEAKWIVIPDYVEAIGSQAFDSCMYLVKVEIPGSVSTIGDQAFNRCYNLAEVHIAEGLESIGQFAFEQCILLSSVEIPDTVKTIGENAFYYCTSLTDVNIPEGITSIDGVFSHCASLETIHIPDSVQSMDGAFFGCENLEDVNIPDGVESLRNTFGSCTNLTTVTIPDSVQVISSTFRDCTSLTSIMIPDNVTLIGEYAFMNCENLTSITIPDKVKTIGSGVFSGCTSLTSLSLPASLKDEYESLEAVNAWKIPEGCEVTFR